MEDFLSYFEKYGVSTDVRNIFYSKNTSCFVSSRKSLGKYLTQEILYFISDGYDVIFSGLMFAHKMEELGFSKRDIFLAHKLAEMDITTHYFSLLAESYSSFFEDYKEIASWGKKSFTKNGLRRLRFCLAILSELHVTKKKEFMEAIKFKKKKILEKEISPFVILIIKATAKNLLLRF